MNRVFLFLPLAVFVVMGVYFALGLREDPSSIPSRMIDRPLPEFDLAAIAEGEPGFSNTDLDGQVALVNVFGTWCPPCEIEHPMLMQISRSGRVPIYGVDWRDEPGAGAAWLARNGNPYQRVGDDPDGDLAFELGITGAPETFLIDRQGQVRFHHVGIIDETVWRDTLLPMIEALETE